MNCLDGQNSLCRRDRLSEPLIAPLQDLLDDFLLELFFDDFFLGIRAPALRASLNATATACFRLETFFPLPDFRVPCLYSCMTFLTLRVPFEVVFFAIIVTPSGDSVQKHLFQTVKRNRSRNNPGCGELYRAE